MVRLRFLLRGLSYGRDFCNILLESEIGDKIDLSFAQDYTPYYRKRVEEADYIFSVGSQGGMIRNCIRWEKASTGG